MKKSFNKGEIFIYEWKKSIFFFGEITDISSYLQFFPEVKNLKITKNQVLVFCLEQSNHFGKERSCDPLFCKMSKKKLICKVEDLDLLKMKELFPKISQKRWRKSKQFKDFFFSYISICKAYSIETKMLNPIDDTKKVEDKRKKKEKELISVQLKKEKEANDVDTERKHSEVSNFISQVKFKPKNDEKAQLTIPNQELKSRSHKCKNQRRKRKISEISLSRSETNHYNGEKGTTTRKAKRIKINIRKEHNFDEIIKESTKKTMKINSNRSKFSPNNRIEPKIQKSFQNNELKRKNNFDILAEYIEDYKKNEKDLEERIKALKKSYFSSPY